jgi:hypothetical protein
VFSHYNFACWTHWLRNGSLSHAVDSVRRIICMSIITITSQTSYTFGFFLWLCFVSANKNEVHIHTNKRPRMVSKMKRKFC